MSYTLLVRPEARADLLDVFHWYQAQRAGLGLDFKLCVDEVFSKLQKHPVIYKTIHLTIRRAIMKRFPFGVFYIIEGKKVIVLAVLHARRDPDNWKTLAERDK